MCKPGLHPSTVRKVSRSPNWRITGHQNIRKEKIWNEKVNSTSTKQWMHEKTQWEKATAFPLPYETTKCSMLCNPQVCIEEAINCHLQGSHPIIPGIDNHDLFLSTTFLMVVFLQSVFSQYWSRLFMFTRGKKCCIIVNMLFQQWGMESWEHIRGIGEV